MWPLSWSRAVGLPSGVDEEGGFEGGDCLAVPSVDDWCCWEFCGCNGVDGGCGLGDWSSSPKSRDSVEEFSIASPRSSSSTVSASTELAEVSQSASLLESTKLTAREVLLLLSRMRRLVRIRVSERNPGESLKSKKIESLHDFLGFKWKLQRI